MSVHQIDTEKSDLKACPIDPILRLLALKWLVHIVWILGRRDALRFNELQRELPGGVSAKVLSSRLKELEKLDIIVREDKGVSPPHVVYHLAPQGRALDEFLVAVELQAQRLPLPDISLLPSDLQSR